MLSQFFYPYKYVELLDCLLQPDSVYRLVRRVSAIILSSCYLAFITINVKHNNNRIALLGSVAN